MLDREVLNSSYQLFCKESGLSLPRSHRMTFPNLHAAFKSASKYDKCQPYLDEDAWLLAGEWVKQHFYPIMGGSTILSQDIVLLEMDKSTSCGYPWSLQYHNKTEMLADNKASQVICDYWTNLSLPEFQIVPIWSVTQKIEMRAVEKLKENNLRTFTAAPIEHSVATNRLCLDMNNKFYSGAGKCWSFVGSSKYLSGWDTLYRRLSKHSKAFELDESQYDSSLFGRAMFGQRDIRWTFLREQDRTPDNYMRLCRIYDSIVHSAMVMENGELLQKHTGNPSGSSNTIVDNTMILFRLFSYAWLLLRPSKDFNYLEFMHHVEAALCGDDNTFTVSDEVVGWFNPPAIAKVWTAIGVTTKTPCDTPRPLKDVCFLSQGFRFDESLGIWFPVPDTERVISSLYAGSNVDDVRWHYLRAAALRIDSYGNQECRKILSRYLEYLNQNYSDQLVGSCNGISMDEIRNVWKSDAWIESLYSGIESAAVESTSSFKTTIKQIDLLFC